MTDKRQVSYDQGKEFADTHGMKFLETSAKTNNNVIEAFVDMTKDIVKNINNKEVVTTKEPKLDINSSGKSIPKSSCCN